MPYSLLMEEVMKRDYLLTKVEKVQNWMGGEMQVPFLGGAASSYAYGQLTDIADITENRNVLGTVPGYKEIWGSMVFNDSDLARHGNMEQSFIKILPDQLEMFIDNMKQAVSVNLLAGSHIVSLDSAAGASNLAGGIVVVNRPARLTIGQFLELGTVGTLKTTGASFPANGIYIKAISIDDKTITCTSDKALTSIIDLTLAGIVPGDLGFLRGGTTVGAAFTSLREQLLSAANGGIATHFGISKANYPYLQAPNFDGSGLNATTILDKIFGFQNETRTLGKGNPNEIIMSFKHLGEVMALLESNVQYTSQQPKTNVFGWTEIDIVGVRGSLKIVGVQEMDDDIMYIMDWRALKLYSNGFFERRESPDGNQYYEQRVAGPNGGYKYITDTRFFGEMVVDRPSYCGIIHSIA